jgi:glycosyltransferase involved in cell wall biosynthesis
MKICFVIPTYNDESSLKRLIDNINKELKNFTLHFIIIDDYSSDDYKTLDSFHDLDLINLEKNQGSQKAISIGLKYLKDKEIDFDYVIIMDADGEDKPNDLKLLIEETQRKNNNFIIFASRKKRMEIFTFKFLYFVYKLIFLTLTGNRINFGNYSCIPKKLLRDIIGTPFIGHHYSAAIIKSKLCYSTIPCNKGIRYEGNSKMSFYNLFLHGLKSLSIFYKEIFLRFLIFFFISNCIFLLSLEFDLVVKLNLLFLFFAATLLLYLFSIIKDKNN